MTHETENVAREHAIAARTALDAFRHHQPEAGMDWRSFDTAVGLLDQTIEARRRPVRGLPPTLLAAGGFPSAMAYVIEEIQAADGPDIEFCHDDIDADPTLPERKQAAVRIMQESLANACRHSKSQRLFLELTLDRDALRIHIRDWGVGFKPDRTALGPFGPRRASRRLKLLGGTATTDGEPEKGTCVTVAIPLLRRKDAHRHEPLRMSPRMRCGEG